MKSIKNKLLMIAMLSLSASLIVLSCSNSPPLANSNGGSGTGVGNGVILGTVIYPDSTPVKGAIVRLRPQTYLADTSGKPPSSLTKDIATLTTDSAGNFSIDSLDSGRSYYIEVNDRALLAKATLFKVMAMNQKTFKLATRVVNPVATLSGTITNLPKSAYIQIYGLERLDRTDSAGTFEFCDLPVGKCEEGECEYKLRILEPQPNGSFKATDYEMEVKAGGKVTFEMED